MSIALMSRIWEECDLKHSHQSVLLALADHADDDGCNVFPSVNRIAWKTGYGWRNVVRVVNDLIESGVLIPVRASDGSDTNEYRIDLAACSVKQEFKEWRRENGRHANKDELSSGVNLTPVVNRPSPQVVNRPSVGDGPSDTPRVVNAPPIQPSGNHQKKPSDETPCARKRASVEPSPISGYEVEQSDKTKSKLDILRKGSTLPAQPKAAQPSEEKIKEADKLSHLRSVRLQRRYADCLIAHGLDEPQWRSRNVRREDWRDELHKLIFEHPAIEDRLEQAFTDCVSRATQSKEEGDDGPWLELSGSSSPAHFRYWLAKNGQTAKPIATPAVVPDPDHGPQDWLAPSILDAAVR